VKDGVSASANAAAAEAKANEAAKYAAEATVKYQSLNNMIGSRGRGLAGN